MKPKEAGGAELYGQEVVAAIEAYEVSGFAGDAENLQEKIQTERDGEARLVLDVLQARCLRQIIRRAQEDESWPPLAEIKPHNLIILGSMAMQWDILEAERQQERQNSRHPHRPTFSWPKRR